MARRMSARALLLVILVVLLVLAVKLAAPGGALANGCDPNLPPGQCKADSKTGTSICGCGGSGQKPPKPPGDGGGGGQNPTATPNPNPGPNPPPTEVPPGGPTPTPAPTEVPPGGPTPTPAPTATPGPGEENMVCYDCIPWVPDDCPSGYATACYVEIDNYLYLLSRSCVSDASVCETPPTPPNEEEGVAEAAHGAEGQGE